MSFVSRLVSVCVLLASIGCRAERAHTEDGRLDVMIRPDSAGASSRPVQARFVLRDQDGRIVDRLDVMGAYETLSVALREGTYLLQWQPQFSFDSAEDVAATAREAASDGTASIAVAAGRVTTVHVRATLMTSPGPKLAELVEDIPSVSILIARH